MGDGNTSARKVNGLPTTALDHTVNPGNCLSIQRTKISGEKMSPCLIPLEVHWPFHKICIVTNEIQYIIKQIKPGGNLTYTKGLTDETPTQAIISFLKVNLNKYLATLTFLSQHIVNYFLSNNNIFSDVLPRYKAYLSQGNQIRENGFQPIWSYFSNCFIDHRA